VILSVIIDQFILAVQVLSFVSWCAVTSKKKTGISSLRLDARPEEHAAWLQNLEAYPGIPEMMNQLASKGVDVERVRTLLYAAPILGGIKTRADLDNLDQKLAETQRHLESAAKLLDPYPFRPRQHVLVVGAVRCAGSQVQEQRDMLAKFRSSFTTIQMTDVITEIIAQDLERAGSRKVNEDLATLLTAASVPGGTRDEVANLWAWDAATVDKRRDRLKRNPIAVLGPYRRLFDDQHVERLVKRYPQLFIRSERKHQVTIGQGIASGEGAFPLDYAAVQEAFSKASRETTGDKKRSEKP